MKALFAQVSDESHARLKRCAARRGVAMGVALDALLRHLTDGELERVIQDAKLAESARRHRDDTSSGA